ncbi:MAG: AraC family transcriptional regulator [Tildeniella nuda ZEHNDER 1965/U140]|nr:AraC family transcriptional regulator [Tildeniella nuda ZEHNDER 1965/U140]
MLAKWHGFRLERHRIFDHAVTPEICFPTHIIGFLLSGNYKKDIFDTGTRRRTITHNCGDALLYPFGLPHIGHSFSQADFLVLYLEPKFVERAARDISAGERIEIIPQPNFEDELVANVAKHLLSEVESGGATGTLYAESLMTALAARLVKQYSNSRVLPCNYKGGLSRVRLHLILEFISEHLAEDLSLEQLAALCCLSQYHFCRLFKQSTGASPHQYLIRQRVERAKQLLLQSQLSIAEVAQTVGFNEQSQLTRHLKRATGLTPMQLRKQ